MLEIFYGSRINLPVTIPTLSCVTNPHLYLGVATEDFTLTLSPILMAVGGGKDGGNPNNSICMKRTQ